jgi:hypothetical protein
MPQSDYNLWIFGKAVPTVGVDFCHAAAEYSYTAQDYIDFGFTDPHVERGDKFGLHIVINETFTTGSSLAELDIWIVTGTTSSPTTKLTGRAFLLADLAAGKHYFIPCKGKVQRYLGAYGVPNTGAATAGQVCMWFGPDGDGAE